MIVRQVNLRATDLQGTEYTLARDFEGIINIIVSYFLSMKALIELENNSLPKTIFVISKCSYFDWNRK